MQKELIRVPPHVDVLATEEVGLDGLRALAATHKSTASRRLEAPG